MLLNRKQPLDKQRLRIGLGRTSAGAAVMRSEVKWRIVAAICVALIYILVTAVFANA